MTPDEETWTWTWSRDLRSGRVVGGFHRHFTIWQENPELYEFGQPTRGWARIDGNTIKIGYYSCDPEPDLPVVAELIAKRARLSEFNVHVLRDRFPEALP